MERDSDIAAPNGGEDSDGPHSTIADAGEIHGDSDGSVCHIHNDTICVCNTYLGEAF